MISSSSCHGSAAFSLFAMDLFFENIKPPLLNHPKHITHILHHDPGDVGHCVDVVLGVVAEAGAGDEVEVFEDGVEAFGQAGVEVA